MRLVIAICAALLACEIAAAGDDEVDYSAPYVTLEKGELVTRYHTGPHEASQQPLEAGEERETSVRDEGPAAGALPALAIVVALAAAFWWLRRRRSLP